MTTARKERAGNAHLKNGKNEQETRGTLRKGKRKATQKNAKCQ